MTPLSLVKSGWFRITSVIVILCLVVLLGTPLLARYLAQQWLLENGGEQVRFEDVDLNLFSGNLVLEGLEVKVDTETTLSFDYVGLDLAWWPLLRRQIDVQSVQLTGFYLVVDNQEPEARRIGGIRLPSASPDGEPPTEAPSAWLSGIKTLTLQDFHLLIRDRKLELDVVMDSLRLTRMAQWTPEQAAMLELEGSINDAPVRVNGHLAPFASQPRYDLELSLNKLQLGAFEKLAAPMIDQLSGLLSYAGELVLEQSDATLTLSHAGKTVVESLRLAMSETGLDTSIGQFSHNGKLAFEQSGENVSLEQDGVFSLGTLDLSVRQPALDVQNGKLELTSRLKYYDSPSGAEMRLAADLTLENLDVRARERKVSLVSAEALRIKELLFQAVDQLSIKTISSEQIRVGKVSDEDVEKLQPLARSDKLQIEGLSRAGNLVAIDSVAYEGFHNRIFRDKDGNLDVVLFIDMIENINAPPAITKQTDQDALKKVSEEEQAEPVDLVIGSIRASEGSSITFVDNSVKPPFATTVTFKEISLEQLDTRKPEQDSPLQLEGAIGKHTRLSLSGDVKPFLKPVSMDLSGQIQAMDLPALSSYTWESLGLMLDSGTLDADLKLASKDEVLDGKVDVLLHQLKLGKVESQSGLQSKIPVPMDTALNTLRDKNNTIKLTIPVEGNMADPKFDVSDAINQVLAKALKAGALSYLKHALQPYGAIITVAQYAGEAATKVRLNPLEFEAGQATLTATGEEYLAKVAKVMQERPKIAIKLCGISVQQDQLFFQRQQQQAAVADKSTGQSPAQPPAMDEQKLIDVAVERATVVKDYLVERHQISASRLVGCRPRTETDKPDSRPRTDLLI
ncbi:MAG: DUF748 domain-containing protein [Gammaproteobacteria bacterium]